MSKRIAETLVFGRSKTVTVVAIHEPTQEAVIIVPNMTSLQIIDANELIDLRYDPPKMTVQSEDPYFFLKDGNNVIGAVFPTPFFEGLTKMTGLAQVIVDTEPWDIMVQTGTQRYFLNGGDALLELFLTPGRPFSDLYAVNGLTLDD